MTAPSAGAVEAETITTSAMLAAAGGFLDAFTYVGHGHVFANAMTGNVVLLGVALGSGNLAQAGRHAVPIVAFILGVAFARALHVPRVGRFVISPHVASLLIETAFLFVVGFLPPAFPNLILTLGIAFVASIQLSMFSKVRGAPYASTFTSGNLRKFAESAFAWILDPGSAADRIVMITFFVLCVSFFLGACIGAAATIRFHDHAAWIVDAWLALVTWRLIAARHREDRR